MIKRVAGLLAGVAMLASAPGQAQSCDPDRVYDIIGSSFHQSVAQRTDGAWAAWGGQIGPQGNVATPAVDAVPYPSSVLRPQDVIGPTNYPGLVGAPLLLTTASKTTSHHTVALTTDGLYAWGSSGVIFSSALKSSAPVSKVSVAGKADGLPPGVAVTDVSMLFSTPNTLAIVTNDGAAWVLVNKAMAAGGRLLADGIDGNADDAWHRVKTAAGTPLQNVVAIRGQVGGDNMGSMMALTEDGRLYAWGNKVFLGDGTAVAPRNYATEMTPPAGATGVPKMIGVTGTSNSSRGNTFFVLYTSGRMYAVGSNHQKQLGAFIDSTDDVPTWEPVRSAAGTPFTDIEFFSAQEHDVGGSSGGAAAALITANGTLYTWGNNNGTMIGRAGSTSFHPGEPAYNASTPASAKPARIVEVGGHTTVYLPRTSARFCYVGHQINGSMGDGVDTGATQSSFNCTATPRLNICGAEGFDYGDAPVSYEAGGGANLTSHFYVDNQATLFLGLNGPAANDPTPKNVVIGTDNNDPFGDYVSPGPGEEDGPVALPDVDDAATSHSFDVRLTNNTGANAYLYAWVDWNNNGAFELGEAASATPITIPSSAASQTHTLTWNGLSGLTPGRRYIRLRLTSEQVEAGVMTFGGNSIDKRSRGFAVDGEVEDHALYIVNATEPPNVPPIAIDVTNAAIVPTAPPVKIAPLAGTDSDGSVVSFRIISLPTHGTLYKMVGTTLVPLAAGEAIDAATSANLWFATTGTTPATFTFAAIDDDGAESVDSEDGDGDPRPGAPAVYTLPILEPSLTLSKTASAANFQVGVAASYTLTVTNTQAPTTAAATITDVIPTGLQIGTLPAGCSNPSGQTVTCTVAAGLGYTAPGNTVSFIIPVTPQAGVAATVSNSATVRGGGDPDCPAAPAAVDAKCTDEVTDTPVLQPVLSVAKALIGESGTTPGVVEPNEVLTYSVRVRNDGTLAATGVVANEVVPAHTRFVAAGSSAAWSCADDAAAGTACNANVGTVAANSYVDLLFRVRADATLPTGSIANAVALNGDTAPDCAASPNDPACVVVPTDGGASGLRVEKALTGESLIGNGIAEADEVLTYSITVRNLGDSAATGVIVNEVVPMSTTYYAPGSSAWTCADGSAPGTPCAITIDSVDAGASATVVFRVRVANPLSLDVTTIANAVALNGETPAPCLVNGPGCVLTPAGSGVGVRKTLVLEYGSLAGVAEPGEVLTYALTITNSTAVVANGILTEIVPQHTRFSGTGSPGWSCPGGAPAGTVCTRPYSVPAGDTVDVLFAVQVDSPLSGDARLIANAVGLDGNPPPCPPEGVHCVTTPVLNIIANDDTATTAADTEVGIVVTVNDIAVGGTIDPDSVTVTGAPPADEGAVNCVGVTCTFTPEPGFVGTTTFTYEVCLEAPYDSTCDTAVVTVTVTPTIDAVNDGPVTVPSVGGTTPSVIGNDTTNGVEAEIGTNVTLTPGTSPSAGMVMNADGTISVAAGTPPGTYTYPYTICTLPATSPATCDSATATVIVNPNDVPTATDDTADTPIGTPVPIDVTGNDHCGDDLPCSISIVTPPTTGVVEIDDGGTPDPADDVIVFTPPPGFDGQPVVFTYEICDANGDCDTATVTVTVGNCGGNGAVAGSLFADLNRDGLRAGAGEIGLRSLVALIPASGSPRIAATDSNGNYLFDAVAPGSYRVESLDSNLANEQDYYATGPVERDVVVATCQTATADFGYAMPVTGVVGDFVWYDMDEDGTVNEYFDANNDGLLTDNTAAALSGALTFDEFEWIDLNGDGVADDGEYARCGLSGARVDLLSEDGTLLASTLTNSRGAYRFTDLALGVRYVTRVAASDAAAQAGSEQYRLNGLCKLFAGAALTKQAATVKPKAPAAPNCAMTTSPQKTSAVLTSAAPVDDSLDFGHLCAADGTVIGLADLVVTKTISDPTPTIGSTVTFTVTVTNNGPAVATNVVVNDNLPSGYAFVSATGNWTAPNWYVGTLGVGESATMQMEAQVRPLGDYLNIATAFADQEDPDPSDNTDDDTMAVPGFPPPLPPPAVVPSLDPWTLALLALALGLMSAVRLRRW